MGSGVRRIDFSGINRVAMSRILDLLARWLPDGRLDGREYVARNPRRPDKRLGSFRINVDSGRWADFAIGAKGGDMVSLAAYLAGEGQGVAAGKLADMLGVPLYE